MWLHIDSCKSSRTLQHVESFSMWLQVRALRAGKPAGPAGQALGSGNSSSLGTGSYGAPSLGLSGDANGLLNAIINRLPPGSLSGQALAGAFLSHSNKAPACQLAQATHFLCTTPE